MSDSHATGPPAAVGDPRPTSLRKISTPAGDRLQTVLEGGNADYHAKWWSKESQGAPSSALGFTDSDASGPEQPYTAIWSDAAAANEASGSPRRQRLRNWLSRRGGWKRLLLVVLLVVAIIVGLTVGLVLGLRASAPSSDTDSAEATPAAVSNPQASAPATTSTRGANGPQPTGTGAPSAKPPAFPIGQYSFVTFLSTVSTDCTSNPSTWTCAPYTLYSEDPSRAMATFNWNITAGDSEATFRISSVSNPFQTTFTDIALSLVDEGRDTEHYFFQFLFDKQVRPTSALTDDNAAALCYYNGTTFQAQLYTREAKGYPDKSTGDPKAAYPLWPFAAKIEEVTGGGDSVPDCYTAIDNRVGSRVNASSLTPRPAGDLCDCLYLNYLS